METSLKSTEGIHHIPIEFLARERLQNGRPQVTETTTPPWNDDRDCLYFQGLKVL